MGWLQIKNTTNIYIHFEVKSYDWFRFLCTDHINNGQLRDQRIEKQIPKTDPNGMGKRIQDLGVCN